MAWKDGSSHSRDAIDRTPNTWRLRSGDIEVVVHRLHGMPPDDWFVSSHILDITSRPLRSKNLKPAQTQAIAIVRNRAALLNDWARHLTAAAKEPADG